MERELDQFVRSLRAVRQLAGLTQGELARRAGVSLRTVRYIESGEVVSPRAESIRKLAAALDAGRIRGRTRCQVRILGPLEVASRCRVVPAGPLKQRSLLGLLALRAGVVVPRDEIIDTLWEENPPSSCINLVHTYISGLRRAIEGPSGVEQGSVIVSSGGGYLLSTDDCDVDLRRFEALVRRARSSVSPDEVVSSLAMALDEWRGPVLADLPDSLRRHPDGLAASMARVTAAVDYAEAALIAGHAADVVTRLTPVAHQEPLHEGVQATFMRALAASGQPLTALRMFVEVCGRLRRELGVEPGSEILAAREDIMSGQRRTAGRVPAQLPAEVTGFVGREDHLARLDRALVAGARLCSIAGTAGVGKTTLAVHWAHRVRDRFPDGQLFANMSGNAPGTPVAPAIVLTRFLRALGVPPDRVPADEEEAAALYRTQLADRRVLVILDDVATADQVRPLLPGGRGSLVLVTGRSRLGGLAVAAGAQRLLLDVLEPDSAVALLRSMIGPAELESLATLAKTCSYLPLALRVAGAHVASVPGAGIADYLAELQVNRLDRLALDDDPEPAVRRTFDLAYGRLDDDARRLFRLLALVPGPDFTPDAAAALNEQPVGEVRSLLARLVAAGLLHEHASRRYQFHDLLRDYALERAGAEQTLADLRFASERFFGHCLRAADAATRVLYPYILRAPIPEATPGGPVTRPLSEQAAIEWLDTERGNLFAAATQAAERGFPGYSWRISDALRGYLWTRGHGAEGIAIAQNALAAAQRVGDVAAEASMYNILGLLHYNLSDYRSARAEHARALALSRRAGDRMAEAAALHNLGRVLSQTGERAEAARRYQQALELNAAMGNRHGEASSLNYLGAAALSSGDIAGAIAHGTRAIALSRNIGDRDTQMRALQGLGLASWAGGRLAEAREYHTRCLELARAIGNQRMEVVVAVSLAEVESDAGRFVEAAEWARVAVREGRLNERRHEVGGLDVLATVDLRQGRFHEALTGYRRALRLARDIGFGYGAVSVMIGLVQVYTRLGEYDEAGRIGNEALAAIESSGIRLLEAQALGVLANVELSRGRADRAMTLADRAVGLAAERKQLLVQARLLYVRGDVRQRLSTPYGEDVAAADALISSLGLTATQP